ncbi:MAG: UvrD-helicase domain-containing protein, partial [Candidatus Dormibacteraceae bacterium]
MLIASKYQKTIFDFVKKGKCNAIIEAVAGSGKTTTIVNALELTKPTDDVVFLSFNKAIAEELKNRVPRNVQARTFHSLCYGVVTKHAKVRRVNSYKTDDLMRDALPESEYKMYGSFVKRLVSVAKQCGLGVLHPADEAHFMAIIEEQDLELENERATETRAVQIAKLILERGNVIKPLGGETMVDFDDLLYFPVLLGLKLPVFDWVFVDEAQDTNQIQRALLRKLLHPRTRLIAVGDSAQAIYGFRGADSDAMKLLAADFQPCTLLPLSVSYRCPVKVVEKAKQYVAAIEARPGAPAGEVSDLQFNWKPQDFGPHDLV